MDNDLEKELWVPVDENETFPLHGILFSGHEAFSGVQFRGKVRLENQHTVLPDCNFPAHAIVIYEGIQRFLMNDSNSTCKNFTKEEALDQAGKSFEGLICHYDKNILHSLPNINAFATRIPFNIDPEQYLLNVRALLTTH